MHPVMFNISGFPVPSYGLMLALSFLAGIWIASYRAKKAGLNPDVVSDMGLYVIIAAVLGSRLYYVFLHFDEFRGNLLSIINPFQNGSIGIGGLVMYGGFLGAIGAAAIFFKVKKIPHLPYLDICAPSVGVGIALTRIGCFLNGCCYGAAAKAHNALCVHYPDISPAGHYQHLISAHGLQPSQLYEAAGGLMIALIVWLVGKKNLFTGLQFYLMVVSYSVLRFFVDFTRVYNASERIGPFSHNQTLCIALFVIFGGLILRKFLTGENKTKVPGAASPVGKIDEKPKVTADQK
ncbi:MAG: prolipoprotein diacylglyceryl transferase [Chitinispirillales bacterium]|jgi:phosphatidylglycerol:prolipoprotein diacylglycerol transferase|nr:prolipoprotein diacylglyceryl transferase [Chitinispirillales bacterium]